MEYKTTAEIHLSLNGLVIYEVFEVDTDTYFACPRAPHPDTYYEFFFSKVGYFWSAEPSPYHTFVLDSVVEALGFVFTNKYPSMEQSKENMAVYHMPNFFNMEGKTTS